MRIHDLRDVGSTMPVEGQSVAQGEVMGQMRHEEAALLPVAAPSAYGRLGHPAFAPNRAKEDEIPANPQCGPI